MLPHVGDRLPRGHAVQNRQAGQGRSRAAPAAAAGDLDPFGGRPGNWKLPFGWGFIGTVEPTVAKVTVSYGGVSSEAVLDHGWFVASGTLTEQVTRNPHIKGYDQGGKLIYDSDEDKSYQQVQ
ncbi:conserved hypothetical protein [Streptomyces sviceus ATCC 29083]|uniref:Uncharacterized protein n=1 Tax=Streptomyces sviceus (strain ATCC 29083 / DSM 924 / JCM 4929 / NBRC 13980 / NCIMB 11184 / NRRL 5439 / UC 5370) TaxID=463191 RepID=D6XBK1_STRX2|nr:conserved hypothetical protein [Streptomyces sviceus ATCC 29083]